MLLVHMYETERKEGRQRDREGGRETERQRDREGGRETERQRNRDNINFIENEYNLYQRLLWMSCQL